MKKLSKWLIRLTGAVSLFPIVSAPVAAQVATNSATPTPAATASTLLEAGTLPVSLAVAIIGIGSMLVGYLLLRRPGKITG